jgi:hypothetical protein
VHWRRVPLPGLVHIFDRNGEQVAEVALEQAGACISIEWDKDGEVGARVRSPHEPPQLPSSRLSRKQGGRCFCSPWRIIGSFTVNTA